MSGMHGASCKPVMDGDCVVCTQIGYVSQRVINSESSSLVSNTTTTTNRVTLASLSPPPLPPIIGGQDKHRETPCMYK